MEVFIHKKFDTLVKLIPKWEELTDEYREITIFQDIGWLKSWWNYRSKKGEIHPYIVEIRKYDRTIGVIPLYISQMQFAKLKFRVLKPIGSELSDYLLPILSKNYSYNEQLNKALEKIYEDKLSWDYFEWREIPEDSFLDTFLNNNLAKRYSFINRKRINTCPYLILSDNVEDVKRKFSKSLLKEILKKKRRMQSTGELIYSRVKSEKEMIYVMNNFFEFHCQRWEKTNTPSRFRIKEERDYTLQTAKNLLDNGLLHLSYLTYENEIIAVEYAMTDGRKIYLYLTAFDPKYSKFSVGNLLLYKLIIDACKNDYEVMDFTRGEESYKQLWGTKDKFNVKYQLFNRSVKSLLLQRIYPIDFSQYFIFRLYSQGRQLLMNSKSKPRLLYKN